MSDLEKSCRLNIKLSLQYLVLLHYINIFYDQRFILNT